MRTLENSVLSLRQREALVFLGNRLTPPWSPSRYAERWVAHQGDYRSLLQELVQAHREEHVPEGEQAGQVCNCLREMAERYGVVRDLVLPAAVQPSEIPF